MHAKLFYIVVSIGLCLTILVGAGCATIKQSGVSVGGFSNSLEQNVEHK